METRWNWGFWTVGVYVEPPYRDMPGEVWLGLLPLRLAWQTGSPMASLFKHHKSLIRFIIGQLEIRLDVASGQWWYGINVTSRRDYGIYVGPFDVQIEWEIMSPYIWSDTTELRLFSRGIQEGRCLCDESVLPSGTWMASFRLADRSTGGVIHD